MNCEQHKYIEPVLLVYLLIILERWYEGQVDVVCLCVFVLVYGCWVECRAAAQCQTRSHINSVELALDDVEKGSVMTERGSVEG